MGYTLTAMIKKHGSEMTPGQVDLVSFGIYDTEVVNFKDPKVNAGALDTVRAKVLNQLTAAQADQLQRVLDVAVIDAEIELRGEQLDRQSIRGRII